ncbi:unnamed protein product [Ambrosiozyma monospora]|uniref:Unnamed protein product n=1 Tax=Ambrosiozyma monospora TaxID=43982 RepID=A0ACB5SV47_AMBMO|nr:unnamed protein product [Ambrosiozyma monospora]
MVAFSFLRRRISESVDSVAVDDVLCKNSSDFGLDVTSMACEIAMVVELGECSDLSSSFVEETKVVGLVDKADILIARIS